MLPLICLASCLLTLGCASTSKPSVVVETKVVKLSVPDALLLPCPKKDRSRKIVTTGDIVSRLNWTEGALAKCSAQIDGIRAWNQVQK